MPLPDPTRKAPHVDSATDPNATTARNNKPNPPALPPTSGTRYTIGAEIARGGMGAVHRATDTVLKREVAVKVLLGNVAPDSDTARRFVVEAEITAQLQHPGIPPVHDLGTLPDGRPFLAMKLIKGETLAQRLKDRDDPSSEAGGAFVAVFEQVCQAVAYAHAHDVIHRDLKPSNIMVGAFGEVQVMDWGLAKVLGAPAGHTTDPDATAPATAIHKRPRSESTPTQAGRALGTPSFMPPEQAAGALDRIDTRSDVFGLGAILAVILTGNPPFVGNTALNTLMMAAQADLGDCFAELDTCGADPELIAVAKRCLAPDPEDRPANAGEVASAVAALRLAAEERARQAELDRVKDAERRKRRKVQLMLATAIALLVAAGGAFAVWREQQRREADAQMQQVQREARAQAEQLQRDAEAQMRQIQRRAADALEAGDLTRAAALFGEMETLAQASPGLAAHKPTAAARRAELERFATFRKVSAAALRDGSHNIRSKEPTDSVLARCEEALGLYGFTNSTFDPNKIPTGQLEPRYKEEITTTARELLVLAAIRLALFDTKDAAAKAAARRALGLLDRAAGLAVRLPGGDTQSGPTAGELMLRMLWHRRLGEEPAAKSAGEQMTAMVKADGGLKSARDYYLLGSVSLHLLKNPKDALLAYQQALKHEPAHFGALSGMSLCCRELKDPRGQITALTACLAVRPTDPELHYFRGMVHFELKEYDDAYRDFDAAVIQDPKYATGYFYRGRMLAVGERWTEAEADFNRAVDLDPKNVQALSWRAVARAKTGRAAEAVADAERAVAAEPNDGLTLFFAARACARAVAATKDAATAKRYGSACVEYLRRALAAGFAETDRLGPGGDFDPIRDRADFQALLATIRK